MSVGTDRICRSSALTLILSLALLGGPAQPVVAQTAARVPDYAVKAAYLYQFAAYVEWPTHRFEDEDSSLVIGVMGRPLLGEELMQIARGRSVAGRPVEVRLLSPEDRSTALHILFIGDDVPRTRHVGEAAASESILVVTDSDDASPENTVVNFRTLGNRVRFEVFLEEAERNGLKLSSRLLAVALRVHGRSVE